MQAHREGGDVSVDYDSERAEQYTITTARGRQHHARTSLRLNDLETLALRLFLSEVAGEQAIEG